MYEALKDLLQSLRSSRSIKKEIKQTEAFCFLNMQLCLFFFFNSCFGSLLLYRLFSGCLRADATLCCGAWFSHCHGFSCCRAWACRPQWFWHTGSLAVALGLQSAISVVVALGLVAPWRVRSSWHAFMVSHSFMSIRVVADCKISFYFMAE